MPSISPLIIRIFDDPEATRARRERDRVRTRNGRRRKGKTAEQ